MSVLVVSESPVWRNEMAALLDVEGYALCLDVAGDAVMDAGRPFDIAVVDLTVRGPSVGAIAAVRSRTPIPILAFSPEDVREPLVLAAYAAGADQFVPRTIQSRELVARIRALVRHSPPRVLEHPIEPGPATPITLDLATGVATVGGVEVHLTVSESEVLHPLLQRSGRIVTREQLIGPSRGRRSDSRLDSLVRSLRNKLEAAEGQRRIVTVRGVGFRILRDDELAGVADGRSRAGR